MGDKNNNFELGDAHVDPFCSNCWWGWKFGSVNMDQSGSQLLTRKFATNSPGRVWECRCVCFCRIFGYCTPRSDGNNSFFHHVYDQACPIPKWVWTAIYFWVHGVAIPTYDEFVLNMLNPLDPILSNFQKIGLGREFCDSIYNTSFATPRLFTKIHQIA